MPIAVEYLSAVERLEITWDKPLVSGPVTPTGLALRINERDMTFGLDGEILAQLTYFNDVATSFGDPGPNRLAYIGGNPALVGLNTHLVQPFDVPATEII